MPKKVCTSCGESKPVDDFYSGKATCIPCNLKQNTERKNKYKAKWWDFINHVKGCQCAKCGYDRERQALEFHHVFPQEKAFSIAEGVHQKPFNENNKALMLSELQKTILLCANCHREIHSGRQSIL